MPPTMVAASTSCSPPRSASTTRQWCAIAAPPAVREAVSMDELGVPVSITNTILAQNEESNKKTAVPDDCNAMESLDYNLIQTTTGCTITGAAAHSVYDTDPGIGDLQNNGGPTRTYALLTGSAGIDAGNPAGCTGRSRFAPDDGSAWLRASDQRPLRHGSLRVRLGGPRRRPPTRTRTPTKTPTRTVTATRTVTPVPPTRTPTVTPTPHGDDGPADGDTHANADTSTPDDRTLSHADCRRLIFESLPSRWPWTRTATASSSRARRSQSIRPGRT